MVMIMTKKIKRKNKENETNKSKIKAAESKSASARKREFESSANVPAHETLMDGEKNPKEVFSREERAALLSELIDAAAKGYPRKAGKILEKGLDVNESDSLGRTPLIMAICKNQIRMAKFLLYRWKADVNRICTINSEKQEGIRDYGFDRVTWWDFFCDNSPLHFAVLSGSTELVRLLISNGADVNASSADGDTPLHTASKEGFSDLVWLLGYNGADVEARNELGRTALHIAAFRGNAEVVELLLRAGRVDLDATDADGKTADILAEEKGHLGLAELIRRTSEIRCHVAQLLASERGFPGFLKLVKDNIGEIVYPRSHRPDDEN
jgi:ankyrin repeat protein